MTTKERFIHNLHQARTAHIRWVNSIKLLISGIDVNEKQISLDATASEFGVWFYNEAMLFSLGTSRMVLEDIEKLFISTHDKYTKMYPIYYNKGRKNLFGTLLGRKNDISDHEREFAQRYYEEIVILSDQLKHKLRIFEAQLMSLSEEKFDEFSRFIEKEVLLPIELKIAESSNDESAYFYGARGR